MKLGIDITYLTDQYSHRGIGRVAKEICKRLIIKATNEGDMVVLFGFGTLEENLQAMELDVLEEGQSDKNQIEFVQLDKPGPKSPLRNLLNFFGKLRPEIRKNDLDVYYAPYFEKGVPSRIVPCLVTVHDAIPLDTGSFSQKSALHNFFKGLFFKFMWRTQFKARKIAAVSHTTAKEATNHGIPEEKISVVYHGIDDKFFNAEKFAAPNNWLQEKNLHKSEILLYDSGLEANKNVESLLDIFKLVLDDMPTNKSKQIKLVITGGSFTDTGAPKTARAKEILNLATELNISKQVVPVGRVSDEELYRLFLSAKAYLNLSNYEGFGFGPLQAMATGTPAIISNNECFMEVSGAAAVVVDPRKPNSAAATIVELLDSPTKLETLEAQGLKHAAKFKWSSCAEQMWSIIKDIDAKQ